MKQLKFLIVGAGISGLSNAFHIFQKFPNATVKIIESTNRVGGAIKTIECDGFICEQGPRSIRNSKNCVELLKIVQSIGLFDEIVPAEQQKYSYVYYKGQLRAIPQKLQIETIAQFIHDNPTIPLKLARDGALFWWNKKKLKQQLMEEDCSISEFLENVIDNEIKENIIKTVFYGIYGTSIENISAQLGLYKVHLNLFKQYSDEKESNQLYEYYKKQLKECRSFRFSEGLEMFPAQLNSFLMSEYQDKYQIQFLNSLEKVDFQSKQAYIEKLDLKQQITESYDYLIINTPIVPLKRILNQSILEESELKSIINEVDTTGLISKNVCFKQKILPKNFQGFGYLVNPKQQLKVLGVVMDSLSYPSLQSKQGFTNLSLMMLPQYKCFTDEFLLEEIKNTLGIEDNMEPEYMIESEWNDYFPIYDKGHYQKSLRAVELLGHISSNSVKIGGNSLFTPAIPELILQSKYIVESILQDS